MPELHFDPFSRPALLGLLHRAIAGSAHPARADITRRRIEQLQVQRTEFLKERSSLSTDVMTAQTRYKIALESAREARLDVQIYCENTPDPGDTRLSLLGRRPGPRSLAWAAQRERLAMLAGQDEEEAEEYAGICKEIEARLQELTEQSDKLEQDYRGLLDTMRGQLAAWVLLQYTGHDAGGAGEQLAKYRRLLRGELSVAVLLVLCNLLENGPQAALTELGDLAMIWEQHSDPLRPVLAALLSCLRDGNIGRREAGMYRREQFSQPGHWNLYRLTRVLGGWPVDMEHVDESGFSATLWALEQVLLTQAPPADWQAQNASGLADWSSGADSVIQLMCCLALWQRGETALIPEAAGLPFAEIPFPEKRGSSWPALYTSLSMRPLSAWPEPLGGAVWSELSCLVLLAAKRHAPDALYRHWLTESYNWPKSPLFWWSMAQLQEDPALLRRIEESPMGLIAPVRASL
jgi:hypothetical protein